MIKYKKIADAVSYLRETIILSKKYSEIITQPEIDKLLESLLTNIHPLESKGNQRKLITLADFLLREVGESFGIMNMYGTILHVNPNATTTLGYSEQELIGTNFFSYLTQEGQGLVLSELKFQEKGIFRPYEIQMLCKNDQKKWFKVTPKPINENSFEPTITFAPETVCKTQFGFLGDQLDQFWQIKKELPQLKLLGNEDTLYVAGNSELIEKWLTEKNLPNQDSILRIIKGIIEPKTGMSFALFSDITEIKEKEEALRLAIEEKESVIQEKEADAKFKGLLNKLSASLSLILTKDLPYTEKIDRIFHLVAKIFIKYGYSLSVYEYKHYGNASNTKIGIYKKYVEPETICKASFVEQFGNDTEKIIESLKVAGLLKSTPIPYPQQHIILTEKGLARRKANLFTDYIDTPILQRVGKHYPKLAERMYDQLYTHRAVDKIFKKLTPQSLIDENTINICNGKISEADLKFLEKNGYIHWKEILSITPELKKILENFPSEAQNFPSLHNEFFTKDILKQIQETLEVTTFDEFRSSYNPSKAPHAKTDTHTEEAFSFLLRKTVEEGQNSAFVYVNENNNYNLKTIGSAKDEDLIICLFKGNSIDYFLKLAKVSLTTDINSLPLQDRENIQSLSYSLANQLVKNTLSQNTEQEKMKTQNLADNLIVLTAGLAGVLFLLWKISTNP